MQFIFQNKLLRWLRILLIVIGTVWAVSLSLYMLFIFLWSGDIPRRPLLYELPSGLRGWVVIQHDDPSCPSIESRGLYVVISVPASGHACTSSPTMLTGSRFVRYEYVSPDGTRTRIPKSGWGGGGEIWAGHTILPGTGVSFKREAFFVGTEAELQKSWAAQPSLQDEDQPTEKKLKNGVRLD